MDDYKAIVASAVDDEANFLRLTLSKPLPAGAAPWVKVSVRPVTVDGRRHLQFSCFDGQKDVTKNYAGDEARGRLAEALAMGFSQVHVQGVGGDIHVRVTRKGKALIARGMPSRREAQPVLAHDHVKRYPLAAEKGDEFLKAVGIMSRSGVVRPSMQDKFHQVNEFLRILEQVVPRGAGADRPLLVVDCGCGSAVLTFAAYHYLRHGLGLPVKVAGVDLKEDLIGKCLGLRDGLGWDEVGFHVSTIAAFQPPAPVDVVLSLHACDTATDEAIAQGIRWGARAILAAPCCQHELHHKLQVPLFRPVTRHGILRERLADILTDAFRALALRIMGYRADVIEFISPEHTSKNLMVRAQRTGRPGHKPSVQEYVAMKEFWSVTPVIEDLLGEQIKPLL